MFDTTAYGEYKSYNSSHLGQSQPCDEDEDEEEEEEEDNGMELCLCNLILFLSSLELYFVVLCLSQIRSGFS